MLVVAGPVDAAGHALPGHPERPERVAAAARGVADLHLGTDLVQVAPRPCEIEALARVHSIDYLDRVRRISAQGGGRVDPDTYATSSTWDDARLSAGAGLVALDALRDERAEAAFVATRPPGHHALSDQAMGFCFFNNVAVAAASLVAAGERVAIVDWDVHHGNGTQAIFWDDPAVLYISTHQWPWYPGSGRAEEVGGPRASGTTVNIPLPSGATGDVLGQAFDDLVTPVVEAFSPTWVLVSAGFDAHRDDPLAGLDLTEGDFAALSRTVARYPPRPGRLVLFLEGGYDLEALRRSVAATLGALVGAPLAGDGPTSGGPGAADVRRAIEDRRRRIEEHR